MLLYATPRGLGGIRERAPETFIHSNTLAKMSTQGPEKWRRVLRERRSFGLSPRKLGPLSPGRAGGKVAVWPRRQRIRLRARSPAPALPDLSHPPRRPPALNLPGLDAARPPWEDRGARFLLLPPAPRAEAVARETGLAGRGGSAPSAPHASLLPGARSPSIRGGAKGQRDGGEPPTYLRARAATPGGQRHPEPPQSLLPPPPEAPLRKRDHWSEAATIPDTVPPSAPPTSPFPHAGLPSGS